jgi:hypothetical protein
MAVLQADASAFGNASAVAKRNPDREPALPDPNPDEGGGRGGLMNDVMRCGKGNVARYSLAALAVSLLAGCALGPVRPQQRVQAATDVSEDHPHPPASYAGVPLDGSTDKLHCFDNGHDTVCRRQ